MAAKYNPIYSGNRRFFGTRKRDVRLGRLTDDIMAEINDGVRNAAVQVMNDLAEKGPVWSGKFRDSWIAISKQKEGASVSNGSFPYNLNNVPQLSLKQKEQVKKIEITNTSKWAKYALDLEEGRFTPPNFPRPERPKTPKGNVVQMGRRDPNSTTLRGQISNGAGGAQITAPLFWYNKYLNGGGLQKSVEAGVKLGSKRNPLGK